jgi:hypothetical protein
MTYQDTAKKLIAHMSKRRDFTDPSIMSTLPNDIQVIFALWSNLVAASGSLESAYRKKEVECLDHEMTSAKADAYAKAEPSYEQWRKLQGLIKAADEYQKFLKKMLDHAQEELKKS